MTERLRCGLCERPLSWAGPLLAAVALAFTVACTRGQDELPGTLLDRMPAPDFRLLDHAGREVTLSGLRGNAVVLTFMYTTCPDFCPTTAEKLRRTWELLGPDAARVRFVAVSVDPRGDTPQAARQFSARHRLPDDAWHYLIGSEAELEPVWAQYGIASLRAPAGTLPAAVGHTEALYLIDPQGRERTLLRGDFDPAQLARALRTLLK
jgi:protein SCO1/2